MTTKRGETDKLAAAQVKADMLAGVWQRGYEAGAFDTANPDASPTRNPYAAEGGPFYDPSSPTGWPLSWTPDDIGKLADSLAKVRALVTEDAEQWPEGHPCRVCGKLSREHPTDDCEAWS